MEAILLTSSIIANLHYITIENLFPLPCLTKKFTGWECLACGGQRSVIALFEGDIILSLKMFPALIPLILIALITLLPKSLFRSLGINRRKFFGAALWATLAITIVGYILRNTVFGLTT